MDYIDVIIGACLFILVLVYLKNTVLELRKLNKEFNKFYRWIYKLMELDKEGTDIIAKSANPDVKIKKG